MQDLSNLAKNSLTVSAMEGGNMMHDNSPAMTAPGSRPVTPMPAAESQPDPTLDMGSERPVGDTGRGQPGKSYSPTPTTWKAAGNG